MLSGLLISVYLPPPRSNIQISVIMWSKKKKSWSRCLCSVASCDRRAGTLFKVSKYFRAWNTCLGVTLRILKWRHKLRLTESSGNWNMIPIRKARGTLKWTTIPWSWEYAICYMCEFFLLWSNMPMLKISHHVVLFLLYMDCMYKL